MIPSYPLPASKARYLSHKRLKLFSILGLCVLCLLNTVQADVWINEFAADNQTGLHTSAGVAADWIELFNDGSQGVDLSGWYLTDRASLPTKWRIPDGTLISANGYLVIFADSSLVSVTNGELHANFSMSKDGEYLGLFHADGTLAHEFAPNYPPQLQDFSFGRGFYLEQQVLGGANTPVRYRVPNAAGTAPWNNGVGALGFTSTNAVFTVRYYEMNSSIQDVDVAESMVANSSYWKTDRTYPIVGQYDIIDFYGTAGTGNFNNDFLFPGQTIPGQDKNWFVLVSEGALYIPSPGLWTFSVGSDDGFRLRIFGHGVDFVSEYTTGRGFATTLATFNFPIAGVYDSRLIYYENNGGSGVEFSAAQDFQADFSTTAFHLTGDPAGGVLHAGAIGSLVDTDISSTMKGVNSRVDAEWTFNVGSTPSPDEVFTLYIRCADGFSASINGTPVASLNAPSSLSWSSVATTNRTPQAAMEWLAYSVSGSLIVAGANVLSVTALNDSASDADFLISPRITRRPGGTFPAWFKTPTPGAFNAKAYTAPTPVVTVSEPRGYKNAPFTVSLALTNGAGEIRYTLDGSVPGTNSALYTAPLYISRTTTLRAGIIDPESVRQNVTTATWLFLPDILQQGATPPAGWPADGQVNGHRMEYGVLQSIVTSDTARLCNGMTNSIPSISLVTDLPNLFDPQIGIYVNPGNDGVTWERPVSVELIDPVHGSASEFQVDGGLRIRGAYSRSISNPKHSFRVFFRSDYGAGTLQFPLFGSEGASRFQKVDLRCSQNWSWAYENSPNDTFVRETFSRDSQRDMGMPYTRSRYYHLYINGQYWGLYQTQERGDADYAETYLGGDHLDWDCIKTSQPGYVTTPSDGTFDAFYALHDIAINEGFSGAFADNYFRVKGLNPDGSRNPSYPVLVDEDNLIIYMMTAYYTGDPDSPVSIWGGMPNNMYALYNRLDPSGFKWLRHDAEHSLGANPGYPVTCDTTAAGATFTAYGNFNPATLHQKLCEHPLYRQRFADLVQKHMFGDGALTATNSQARFQSRMNEIDTAIIGESARWGRGKTRDATWLPACNSVLNTYFPQRRDIVISQFRAHGWFPALDAPAYSIINAEVPPGQVVTVSGASTFYYTTDGSDPRLPNGSLNPAAIKVVNTNTTTTPRTLIARGADWRYYDLGSEPPLSGQLTWRDRGFPDSSWSHGPAIIGFAGSATANTVATTTRRYVNGTSGAQVTTTYLRHTFNLDSTNGIAPALSSEMLRDDGAVVYLNGTEVPEWRQNMNAGETDYTNYANATVGSPEQNTYYSISANAARLLRVGSNTVAVAVHQCNAGSSDLYFDFSVTTAAEPVPASADLVITNDVVVKARAFNGLDWSALSENALTIQRPMEYDKLRVSELMYAPPVPPVGSPYTADDFAWIELRYTGTNSLRLEGVAFIAGITHTFAPFALTPGARLVLAKNPVAFATRYPTNNINLFAWTSGNLARSGEMLSLATPGNTNILTFTYSRTWYPETFGTGSTLVTVDHNAQEALWSTALNWRPSRVAFGTPGWPEPPMLTNTRLTADRLLVVDAPGLEGTPEVWVSEDLVTWTPCESGAWSRNGEVFTIDLKHPSLLGPAQSFFKIRIQQ